MDIPQGVFFYSEDIVFVHHKESSISQGLATLIKDHEFSLGCISIVFCSDEYLLQMNKEHLNHDYYTDIITFPMQDDPLSGDLFISIDRVKDNANQNNSTFESELDRIIIHGVLHLVGYGDKTDSETKEMRAKENYYLNILT